MIDEMRWAPMVVAEAVQLFAGAPFRWWIGGGNALELHTGRSWRLHDDTDVGIVRSDCVAVYEWLADWDLAVAAGGLVSPWDGRSLFSSRSENNVWVRTAPGEAWRLDLTIGAGDDERWIYRRDPSVFRGWGSAVLWTGDGLPYLAPDLQLLFKSKSNRPKDDEDARQVIPVLAHAERVFLAERLPAGHDWRRLLDI
jgi:hypothetical protein